ncbi:ribonuclease R family protein [Brachyspira hampsonii]|uniref:Ribonuclease R n=1 Tax=Brachyspira hampsonii TaxID=1287055 RepID=A0AAC9XJC0_9SPIR|nr:VacB/RNase II family 3'-5' exoribonuclease [Brachyspira hampsonii]ASJ20370.1 ribonuclease R [Brachyspira hampsonii]ELV06385.1 VacB and RNase II family 3'-5' exoribonuclease [Brachyspira hampsonii 30599]MBW5379496.1 VacB/RNase II family 3'-5' exoribonuclease [Brachyspira hampsonii]MBW5410865.1 VacB/RNase II family 3'-5' exoribonuclease [Brachyspira hampsonii]OEJ16305.1 ribonuclease R [Brachyspira hampsonii]
MKVIKFLKRINKEKELDISEYKNRYVETKKDKLKFDKMLQKSVSMGLVMKKSNILKLTNEGKIYLEKESRKASEKVNNISESKRDRRNAKNNREKGNKKTSIPKPEIKMDISNAKKDAEIIAKAYNVPTDFPKKCLEEAKLLPDSMENVELEFDRIDLRDIKTVTIDGADSKDFDDAISIEKLNDGYKLGIHIADVSHFVVMGSALDREARKRGNSVYLIDTVYPMFPHELSNGICSLNEGVSRFTMTVFVTIDNIGNVKESTFHKSVIKSSRRLTYDYAQDVLDGIEQDEDWLIELLKNADDVKKILLQKRIENGSIEFNLNETQIILDKGGNPKDFFISERKETHKIIEELMLIANCEVAKRLKNIKGSIYRVHDSPDIEKLDTFTRIAFNRGYKLTKDADGNLDFHSFIESIMGKPDEKLLLTLLLRSMKQAVYDVNNIGHFGLGFEYYTHFTSPIRRYTDLLTHRLLKFSLEGINNLKPTMQQFYINSAQWCSKTERVAVECERSLTKVKAARFMKDKIGNEYNGIISGITNFGIFVEIEDRGIEGLIRYAVLKSRYRYDENEQAAYSEEDAKWYTLGDRIRIVVYKVDIKELFIDFIPASEFDNSFDDRDIIDSRDFLNKKKNKKEIYSRKSHKSSKDRKRGSKDRRDRKKKSKKRR